MDPDLLAHYARLADHYDENWAYSDVFLSWMTRQLATQLGLQGGETVVDLGAGTGLYAEQLLKHSPGPARVICLDPSEGMLRQVRDDPRLVTAVSDAAQAPDVLHRLGYQQVTNIFIKEAVHHFVDRHRDLLGLANLVAPGGRLVVAMLPPAIQYPLFSAALRAYEADQPHYESVAATLREAGMEVDARLEGFPLRFPLERYLAMVRSRYMSLLSQFSDEEIEAGIGEIREQHADADNVEFEDVFAFVTGARLR